MQVRYNVHFDVKDRERFEAVAAEAIDATVGKPGTVQYDWFISDDGARSILQEVFADDDAALAHLGAVGPDILPRLLEASEITAVEMLGQVSDTIRAAYAELAPVYMSALRPRAVH